MRRPSLFPLLYTLTLVIPGMAPCLAQVQPNAGMMRFPDVSAESIVFVYGEDLWIVPRAGGMAAPLAAPKGEEALPRFSPDGRTIAFVGNYDGNDDIYTISVNGGPARRVTYHPAAEGLCDWTPDGKLLYSTNGFAGLERQPQLFVRALDAPLSEQLPVPYGTNGSINSDGDWLAYTPHSRDYRTWKRYRGGMASDIWLFNLKNHESKQITDFEGTDSLPMWHGGVVYYLSDGGDEHRLNLWSFDTQSGERKQVTRFAEYDCKWPAIGPGPAGQGEIVVQNGKDLYLVDLSSGAATAVTITIPGDRPKLRPQRIDAAKFISGVDLSPSAKRVAVTARGDVWTLPAKEGSPRNLTRTNGAAERDATWSPDGKWIAYFSDASGEYELYITQSDGRGETKQLTKDGSCFRFVPTWSPDSRWIGFTDKTGSLWLHSLESGESKLVDREPSAGSVPISWSHDSRWIAYPRSKDEPAGLSALWVYNLENGMKRRVTEGYFNDATPVFDRKGDFLFCASHRSFQDPRYDDLGNSFIYSGTQVLLAIPLRGDVKNPLIAESDEENWQDKSEKKQGDEKESDSKEKPKSSGDDADPAQPSPSDKNPDAADPQDQADTNDKKGDEPQPVVIDFEGIERRAFALPIDPGNFGSMGVNDKGQLIYVRRTANGDDGKNAIKLFDLEEKKDRKEKTVVEDAGQFTLSADGKKLVVIKGFDKLWIVDAAADQKLESPVPTDGMIATIDPAAEWKQVFRDAWRIERDYFYDPNMHGVNWQGVYDHYAAMLPDCVTRRDVSFLIREMIAELNVGHAYYREGDVENPENTGAGLLGCRFELHDNAFRIAQIYEGGAWDIDARNPLASAGVKPGQYLLAVNGLQLDPAIDPYASFQGNANRTVTLTVSDDPTLDTADSVISVKLLASDMPLRFRGWIERNRKYVDEKSGGQVGYIYVTNTGIPGQNDLVRQFVAQRGKAALIIDDRWNGGGQIPTRFIELLNRPATNFWAVRDGIDWVWPTDSHQGPMCMLANGMAGSGGDMFPGLFKQNKLGPVIGMRTWGGLVGISGNPSMIDGSSVTAPTFAFYELDGTWGVEGHGVDPDIKVVDDPGKMADGGDPQLDVAIEEMTKAIADRGFHKPPRPAYPDRSKFGLRPEDK